MAKKARKSKGPAKRHSKPRGKPRAADKAKSRRKVAAASAQTDAPLLLLPVQAASAHPRGNGQAKRRRPRVRRPKPLSTPLRWATAAGFAVICGLAAVSVIASIERLTGPPAKPSETVPLNRAAYAELRAASTKLSTLEAAQQKSGSDVIDTAPLEQQLAKVQVALESRDGASARALLKQLDAELAVGGTKVAAASAAAAADPSTPAASVASVDVPIIFYHKPPDDFGAQMDILQQRGYTTVALDQVAAALTSQAPLPAKPVVITFDDGFADQMGAATYLAAHGLKATFFIIDGGAASNYCIGANRHQGASCGDAYLTWDQIKTLDHNPLFTIASHTIDHLDLPAQTPDVQAFQIIQGKHQLEQHLGHRVDDFAYPYGDFDATTLGLVHQAGFIAAVTTVPGTTQTADALLTLKRIRDTYSLP